MLYPKNAMLENNLGHFHIQTYAQAKLPCKVKLNMSLTGENCKAMHEHADAPGL